MNDDEKTVSNETIEEQTMNQNQSVDEETNTATENESTEQNSSNGKFYTEEEFNNRVNEAVDKRVSRKMSKLEREFEKKIASYKDTENVLQTALGTKNIDESNEKLREFYEDQGIDLPDVYRPGLSKDDARTLGKKDAEDFFDDGYDAMEVEANRLASKGYENLNDREKAEFETLGDRLTAEKRKKELLSVGGSKDLLNDENFKDFTDKFDSKVSIKDIYDIYKRLQPKPKVGTPGSMINHNQVAEKDYYTEEELDKLTSEDLDDPKVFEKAMKSLQKI